MTKNCTQNLFKKAVMRSIKKDSRKVLRLEDSQNATRRHHEESREHVRIQEDFSRAALRNRNKSKKTGKPFQEIPEKNLKGMMMNLGRFGEDSRKVPEIFQNDVRNSFPRLQEVISLYISMPRETRLHVMVSFGSRGRKMKIRIIEETEEEEG